MSKVLAKIETSLEIVLRSKTQTDCSTDRCFLESVETQASSDTDCTTSRTTVVSALLQYSLSVLLLTPRHASNTRSSANNTYRSRMEATKPHKSKTQRE
jgi:hypothetical protein